MYVHFNVVLVLFIVYFNFLGAQEQAGSESTSFHADQDLRGFLMRIRIRNAKL